MKISKNIALAVALLGATTVAGGANAATTVYKAYDANTSRGAAATTNPNATAANVQFQSALSGTSTESFESFADGRTAPLALNFTGSAGPLTATLTGAGEVNTGARTSPTGSGQFATAGSKFYTVTSNNFGITFGTAVAAFSFFTTDIESDIQITLNHVTGPSETFGFASLFGASLYGSEFTVPSGSVNYLGFINTGNLISSVSFAPGANSRGDILGFDQLTIGDAAQVTNPPAVPEPATWAMMLLGFAMIGTMMRGLKASDARFTRRVRAIATA